MKRVNTVKVSLSYDEIISLARQICSDIPTVADIVCYDKAKTLVFIWDEKIDGCEE